MCIIQCLDSDFKKKKKENFFFKRRAESGCAVASSSPQGETVGERYLCFMDALPCIYSF